MKVIQNITIDSIQIESFTVSQNPNFPVKELSNPNTV